MDLNFRSTGPQLEESLRLGETIRGLELVKKIGFQSIYVLVDRPDETEKTGNDPKKTYQLIQPLMRDLELLGLPGYGFKFFLWDQIEPFFRSDARPDRVPQYELKWNRNSLKELQRVGRELFTTNFVANDKNRQ